MRMTFHFRRIPFLACAAAVVLGVLLGQWQMRRAHEKQAIETLLTERGAAPPLHLNAGVPTIADAEYRHAVAHGEFRRDWPIYLDNRPHAGRAGFYVLMPFRLAGSDRHILVARGWVPRDPVDRTRLPPLATPAGIIDIEGVVKRNPGHILQLGAEQTPAPNAILQNLDVQRFAETSKLSIVPLLFEQTGGANAAGDGLVRDWPRPSTGVDRHLGYAFQWYALAVTAFLFFIVTGFRRGTTQAETGR